MGPTSPTTSQSPPKAKAETVTIETHEEGGYR